mgnify:CR=1 FL=1
MINRLLKFLDASPVNFLAARNIACELEQNGYRRLDPQQPLGELKAGISIVSGDMASLPRTMTRPASVSGRSNHVLMIGPPYTSVLSFVMPPSHTISGFGFIRKVGA